MRHPRRLWDENHRDPRHARSNLPLEAPYVWAQGTLPGFTQTIIEVVTDEGVTGLGEAPGAGSAGILKDRFAPLVLGRDPLDIAGCERVCLPYWRGAHSGKRLRAVIRAFGGLEMALWDLRGKLWNQPLYQLFGGAVRKEIPFTEYFAFPRAAPGPGAGSPAPRRWPITAWP